MADEQTQTPPSGDQPADSASAQEGASLEGGDEQTTTFGQPAGSGNANTPPPKKPGGIKGFLSRFSMYLLLFVLVLVIAIIVVVVAAVKSNSKPENKIGDQTLTQSDLGQLAQSDVTVGDVKQTLSVQSNAVFAGQVLVRKDLQVAGKLEVGGSLSLTGITVSGDSVFDQIQVNKNISVGGDAAIQGQLTIQKSLAVNGGGTFNGPISAPQLTVGSLQMSGDLALTHHIAAGGVNPGRSNGNALGGGGTASVSGSDTAGSITINTGGSPASGCMVTVNFATKFNATPHVVVTPVEAAAAGLQYYVTRNTSGFSVCTANAPPAGATFGFDYIVFD